VLFGVAALAVFDGPTVLTVLAVETLALCLLAGGVVIWRRLRIVGPVLGTLAVVAVALLPVWLLWARTVNLLVVAQFGPGAVGLAVLAGGLLLPATGSRRLVKAGTGLLFLSVLTAGVVRQPPLATLLGSGVLTVLAWDAGENAIGLGDHLGRRASTYRAEAVHLGGTALVGVITVAGGWLVTDLGSPGLPLGAFLGLVTALVLLAGALHG
jgi:hypothetical protein